MFISKHKNGYYYIVYKNESGKRAQITTGTKLKGEANKFYINFRSSFKEKLNNPPAISLWQFAVKYMEYSEAHHSKLTSRDYNITFKKLMMVIGRPPINQITHETVQSFITNRIRTGSIHQGRKDLINLKAAFGWAVNEGLLSANPAQRIKRIKPPEKLPTFFSKEEFDQLISTIDNKDIRDLVVTAVNTGMRQGELLTLKWRSVYLMGKYIALDNQYFLNKSRRVRTIPLNKKVCDLLNARKQKMHGNLVFTYNDEPIRQSFITHKFKKIIKKAGLRKELHFHSLRHTFATWLVQKGVSIYQISKLLGHADVTTTQIYAHLDMQDLSNVVKNLDD